MKDLKIALLGFGNAGRGFAKMLTEKQEEIREIYGRGVLVTAIATHSKGTIVNDRGIDLRKAWTDVETEGKFAADTPGLCTMNALEVIEGADCDVVCELTPLNIFTGQPPSATLRKLLNGEGT